MEAPLDFNYQPSIGQPGNHCKHADACFQTEMQTGAMHVAEELSMAWTHVDKGRGVKLATALPPAGDDVEGQVDS